MGIVTAEMIESEIRRSELAVRGTCVDLLTDGGILTGGKKKGRIERENFLA